MEIIGRRVAQVRVVFSLPDKVRQHLFHPGTVVPRHLVYVQWFSKFPDFPDQNHRMYKVSRCVLEDKSYLASIIPLANVFRSVHLLPKFGPVAPSDWISSNVLEHCKIFYVNSYTDKHLNRVLF